MAGGFKLEGFAELEQRLAELPSKIAKGAIRKGTRKAAKKVKAAAKGRVPVLTGHLKRQMAEWPAKKQPKTGYKVLVGVRHMSKKKRAAMKSKGKEPPKGAAYAVPLEYGARGRPARPFLRPALASAGPSAMAEMKPDIVAEAQRLIDKGRA